MGRKDEVAHVVAGRHLRWIRGSQAQLVAFHVESLDRVLRAATHERAFVAEAREIVEHLLHVSIAMPLLDFDEHERRCLSEQAHRPF